MALKLHSAADKLASLIRSGNFSERAATLAELRVCRLVDRCFERGHVASTMEDFRLLSRVSMPQLADLLVPDGAAERAVDQVRRRFLSLTEGLSLPFPAYFNADASFGMFCYAFTRVLRPNTVVEVGVGYGTSSALSLRALEENQQGRLVSLDLPPLGDYRGEYTGMAIPGDLRQRWTLHKQAGSRKMLKPVLRQCESVDLFVADGGSVSSLQRFELSTVWPFLSPGGWVIVNNSGGRFPEWARRMPCSEVFAVWQTEKTGCITSLIHKQRALQTERQNQGLACAQR